MIIVDTFQFSEASKVALIGSSITMLVAIGGWIFSYLLQRDAKRTVQNERKITRLEDEIRARIALEKAACEWVAELTSRTSEAVKREIGRAHV